MKTIAIRLSASLALALSMFGTARADEAPKFPSEDQILGDLDAKCSFEKLGLSQAVQTAAYEMVEMNKWQGENLPNSKPVLSADVEVVGFHKTKCMMGYLTEKLGENAKAKDLAANKSTPGSVGHILNELRDKLEVESANSASMDCHKDRWNFDSKERCLNKSILPHFDHFILRISIDMMLRNAEDSEQNLTDFRQTELDSIRARIKRYRSMPPKEQVFSYGYPIMNMNSSSTTTTTTSTTSK